MPSTSYSLDVTGTTDSFPKKTVKISQEISDKGLGGINGYQKIYRNNNAYRLNKKTLR